MEMNINILFFRRETPAIIFGGHGHPLRIPQRKVTMDRPNSVTL